MGYIYTPLILNGQIIGSGSNIFSLPTGYRDDTLLNGLLAYYKFDEAAGNTCDDATGVAANDASAAVATPPTVTAKLGSYARDFQLGTGGVCIPNNVFTSVNGGVFPKFTMAFWIKFDQLPSDTLRHTYLFATYAGLQSSIVLWMAQPDNNLRFKIVTDAGATYNEAYSNAITDKVNYMHIACVLNGVGNQMKIYINGVDSVPGWGEQVQAIVPEAINSINDHYIGNAYNLASNEVDGKIDEFGMWSRNLTPTEVSTLYNNGVGKPYPFTPTYTAKYQTVYDAFATKPNDSLATAQNTMVAALDASGLWDKMDLLYIFANNASNNARINWKSPGTYDVSVVNNVLFTANRGFKGNIANSAYLIANWNPSINGVNYQLNSAGYGMYILNDTSGSTSTAAFMNKGSAALLGCAPNTLPDSYTLSFINSNDDQTRVGVTTSKGFWLNSRDSSSTMKLYQNSALVDTETNFSTVKPSDVIHIFANQVPNVYSDYEMGLFFTCSSLSYSDVSSLYSIFNTYLVNTFTPEYKAVYNAFTTKPEITVEAAAQNTLVKSLVDNGLWSRMDLFYVFANNTSTNALINWKNPGTFNATDVSSPTFTTYRGFTGDGSYAYISTNWNPSVNGINYSTYKGAIGVYLWKNLFENKIMYGAYDGINYTSFMPSTTGGAISSRINSTMSISTAGSVNNTLGLFISSRNSSSNISVYDINGDLNHAENDVANSKPNSNLTILRAYDTCTNFSQHSVSMFFVMNSVSTNDASLLYPIIKTYMNTMKSITPKILGEELITSPSFDSCTGWSIMGGTAWDISVNSGIAIATNITQYTQYLRQANINFWPSIGDTFRYQIEVSSYSSGLIDMAFSSAYRTFSASTGLFTKDASLPVTPNRDVVIRNSDSAAGTFTISSVSLKQYI